MRTLGIEPDGLPVHLVNPARQLWSDRSIPAEDREAVRDALPLSATQDDLESDDSAGATEADLGVGEPAPLATRLATRGP